MAGRLLLDSNAVIAIFANEDSIRPYLLAADEVLVPSIVLGELYYGARRSARASANEARIDQFAASTPVLPCDTGTAREYGLVKERLRAKGRPIPENDVWIAAVAQQHGLTVLSRDQHLQEIDGL